MNDEQFSHRVTKRGKVFVWWHGSRGKLGTFLKGAQANRLSAGGRSKIPWASATD